MNHIFINMILISKEKFFVSTYKLIVCVFDRVITIIFIFFIKSLLFLKINIAVVIIIKINALLQNNEK